MISMKNLVGRIGVTLALTVTTVGLSMAPAQAVGEVWTAWGPYRPTLAQAGADIPGLKQQCLKNVSRPTGAGTGRYTNGWRASVVCRKIR